MRTDDESDGEAGPLGLQRALNRLRPDLPGRMPANTRSLPAIELHVATVDVQGRVPLGRAAATMSWCPDREVVVSVHDSVLRLTDHHGQAPAGVLGGIGLALDRRLRVQLPYVIRTMTRFRPGVRLIILTVRDEGLVAAVPMGDLIDGLMGGL